MPERIPQSATIRVPLQAYLASDHVTPATGLTVAITISKNGGAYGNPSAGATNATEIASGSYYVDLSTTDTGTTGPLFVKGTSATIDTIVTIYNVVVATNGGFTALPAAVAGVSGGLPTLDAALTVSALAVNIGTAQAGAAATITLAAGASAIDSTYVGTVVSIYTGTGAGQSRTIIGYVGATKVATVGRNWATNPDSTSVYKVHGLSVPRVDDNLAVIVQAGTGTGQLDFTSGVIKSNLAQILGTALTETAGLLAGGFKKWFNVAAPTGTLLSIPDAVPDAAGGLPVTGSRLTAIGAVASVTAGVTVATNNDKTGYGLSAAAVQAIWDALTSALTVVGSIGKKLADWTIGTAQTGDSFARLGAAGAGLTALGDARITNLDAAVSTRLATSGYTAPDNATIAAIAGFVDTEVAAIKTVADRIDGMIELDGAVYRYTTNALEQTPTGGSAPTVSAIADEVQTRTIAAVTVVNGLAANIVTAAALAADAGTEIGTAVWATGTRVLTAGTNIALAKGVGVTGFTDLSAAQVNTEVDTALADVGLVTYIAPDNAGIAAVKAKTDNIPIDPADASVIAASFGTVNSTLLTVAGYIDTEVAAIKVIVDRVGSMIELDGGVYRYTINALEQAPSGSGSSPAVIAAAVWDEAIAGHVAVGSFGESLSGVPTANQNADALLDRADGIETGWTPRQTDRIILSVLAGKASGMESTTQIFRDVGDTKNRVTATVNSDGRTSVTLDAS